MSQKTHKFVNKLLKKDWRALDQEWLRKYAEYIGFLIRKPTMRVSGEHLRHISFDAVKMQADEARIGVVQTIDGDYLFWELGPKPERSEFNVSAHKEA